MTGRRAGKQSRRPAAATSATVRAAPCAGAPRIPSPVRYLSRPDEPATVEIVGRGWSDELEEDVLERRARSFERVEDDTPPDDERQDSAGGRDRIRDRDAHQLVARGGVGRPGGGPPAVQHGRGPPPL